MVLPNSPSTSDEMHSLLCGSLFMSLDKNCDPRAPLHFLGARSGEREVIEQSSPQGCLAEVFFSFASSTFHMFCVLPKTQIYALRPPLHLALNVLFVIRQQSGSIWQPSFTPGVILLRSNCSLITPVLHNVTSSSFASPFFTNTFTKFWPQTKTGQL